MNLQRNISVIREVETLFLLIFSSLFLLTTNSALSQNQTNLRVSVFIDSINTLNYDSLEIEVDTTSFFGTQMVKAKLINSFGLNYDISIHDRVRDLIDTSFFKPTDFVSIKYKSNYLIMHGFLWSNKRDKYNIKSISCFNKDEEPLYTIIWIDDTCRLFIDYDLIKHNNKVKLNYYLVDEGVTVSKLTFHDVVTFDEKLFKINIFKSIDKRVFINKLSYSELW